MSRAEGTTNELLRVRTAKLHAIKWNAAWTLDIAIDETDWENARLLLAVPLAHLGEGKRVEVRQHRDGTWWSDPTSEGPRRIVPWTQAFHEWGDETTGRLRTRLIWAMPSPAAEGRNAASCAAWLASDPSRYKGRAREAALAIAADLASGVMADGLRRAASVMRSGHDDEHAVELAEGGFRARVELEQVASVSGDSLLIDALAAADEALEAFGEAVLLVSDASYAEISRERALDEHAWWGRRALLERTIPTGELMALLAARPQARRETGARAPARREPGGIFLAAAADHDLISTVERVASSAGMERRAAFERAMLDLAQTPAPWLRVDLAQAVDSASNRGRADADLAWRAAAMTETSSPAPGRVPLALYLPEQNEGVVLELRIERGSGGLWGGSIALQALARDAVRQAHAAVSALSLSGQPKLRLEEHMVRIVGPERLLEAIREIDGSSIGLPAALAFASLWLDRCVPSDLAATGALASEGARVCRVGPGSTAAKARALASWGHGRRVRLLLPDENAGDAREMVEAVPVAGLAQALQVAGLELGPSLSWTALGDIAEREAALESLLRDIKTHNLARHRVEGMDPWLVLADRMSLLIHSLQGSRTTTDRAVVDLARAYAALAYTHAGDERATSMFPADLQLDGSTPPPVQVFKLLSQLVASIGSARLATCVPLIDALDAALSELREDERAWMAGLVRGTQGRAWMHAREASRTERLAKALPLLREAVAHHGMHAPNEAGRSRIYLAMALRMAGRFDEAAEELKRATQDLHIHTQSWSGSYYRATNMYLAYERARLRVARGAPEDLRAAIRDTDDALREARERGGFWPAMGIWRTRAWAFHLLGDTAEAQACATRARALASQAPDGARDIVRRITEELDTPNATEGEVY